MIKIDTNVLTELSSVMQSACAQIDDAVQLLNQTTVHADWGCKERDIINENTIQNKNSAIALQEAANSFSMAVTDAAAAFVNEENSIIGWTGPLEDIIQEVIQGPFHTGTPIPSQWGQDIFAVIDERFPIPEVVPIVAPITEIIPNIIDFATLSLGGE